MAGLDSASFPERVERAVDWLRGELPVRPKAIVVLGTGLSSLANEMDDGRRIPYSAIPGFPISTAPTHRGDLVCGTISGTPVAVLCGRLHPYEGFSAQECSLPVRVLALLGARVMIATNAAGGLNQGFAPGDLMAVTDHINLQPDNPLRGQNPPEWGPRFPDLSQAYSKELIRLAEGRAADLGLPPVRRGVYACVPGPSLETPAETRYLKIIGADAVGMSTVPEVIVARHAGLDVLALSIIANVNNPDDFRAILLDEVVATVHEKEKALNAVLRACIAFLAG